MTSQFDPFASPQPEPSTNADNAVITPTTSSQQPGGGAMTTTPSSSTTTLRGNSIQFKSSLQAKQDAIREKKEKEQQRLLLQQQQMMMQQPQAAFSSLGQPTVDNNGSGPNDRKNDDNDPFAGLFCMPMTSPNAKKRSQKGIDHNKKEKDDDDDEQIPFPEDPVLYQAQEAALYAQELLEEQARKNENKGGKVLNQLWSNAQGLFTPPNKHDSHEPAKETKTRAGEIPKPQPRPVVATQSTTAAPSAPVPLPAEWAPHAPSHQTTDNVPNTPTAAYANAPSPVVVPVPRPAHGQDLDPDGAPWYARHANSGPVADGDQQQQPVPWYARSPSPEGLHVSVADVEYTGGPGTAASDRVPWYSRGQSAEHTPNSSSRQVGRPTSPGDNNNNRKRGVGSGMGASVLGGMVGLVAMGPLAGVAAAGGLAYASAKDGVVGDVVRGAGSLVSTAISTTAAAGRKKNNDER